MSAVEVQVHSLTPVALSGAEIIERRNALKWSRKALAEKAGIDRGQLSKIENGTTTSRGSTLGAIDTALREGEAAQRPAPPAPRHVTFRITGQGLNVTVDGPIDDIEELEASARRLIRDIGEGR